MPEIRDGATFLRLVERQGQKLGAALETDEEREEAMLSLLDIAVSSGPISPKVQQVLKAIAPGQDFADRIPAAA